MATFTVNLQIPEGQSIETTCNEIFEWLIDQGFNEVYVQVDWDL